MQKMQIAVNEHGRPIGEDHPRAKLTNREVDLLHRLADEGLRYLDIARMLEVSLDTVKKIRCGARRSQSVFGHRLVHLSA
jgi:DNA-binding NarL/FixJ family response regulator